MKNWPLEKLFSVAAVMVFVAATTAAILLKPEFVFLKDQLSELGREGNSVLLFNSGMAISAVFVALFFAVLAKKDKNDFFLLLAWLSGIVSAAALAAMGVFPIQFEPEHSLAAYAFFSTAALAVLLASVNALLAGKNNFALLALLGAAEVVSTLLFAQHRTATLQALTIALFGAWMLAKAFLSPAGEKI